jgi:GTP-binding protein
MPTVGGYVVLLNLQIGETLCSKEAPVALPTIKVEEPTVSMTFKVCGWG